VILPFVFAAAAVPAVIPKPSYVIWHEGLFFGRPMTRFVGVSPKDTDRLKSCLKEFLPTSTRSGTLINFKITPGQNFAQPEYYRLDINRDEIDLEATTATGLYWGLQTLRQLKQDNHLPCMIIEDGPAFAWRGVMLDEARHFLGEQFVKHFIDVMAMYKFNVLHWHLTDDQGWRIEIKSHPELTRIGAWRKEPDGTKTGGYYTQKQIKEIIAYAANHYITIVPEIEMPGHSSAAIASDPALGCFDQKVSVSDKWGTSINAMCPGKDSTFSFIADVTKEVSNLFHARYIHIGGDEVSTVNWQNCPNCQARIKSEGLKDEKELQSYFTRRAASIVSAEGCTPIGWHEVLRGAPTNMIVQIWSDQDTANKAIETGHQVILSPELTSYLSRQPTELPLSMAYGYEPLKDVTYPTRVLGIEAALWSENITAKNCMMMFLPRGLASSEIAWSNPQKDFAEFQSRVAKQLAFLDRSHIDYGSADQNLVKFAIAPELDRAALRLTATFGVTALHLRYTTDGTQPTASSAEAASTIEWPVGKTLRVAVFKGDRPIQDPVDFATTKSLAYASKITFETQPLKPYTVAGPEGLVDGLLGTHEFRDGIWLGWQGADLMATCDLGRAQKIHEIALHCLQEMRSWILMPTVVQYEISGDGQNWQPFGEVPNTLSDHTEGWNLRWFTAKAPAAVKARYIRITARNYGKLPAWHAGAGGNAWIFADELSVK